MKKETWLVTGAAGFIGSHLVEALLLKGQSVIGMDNFSTGTPQNLQDVRDVVGNAVSNFRFLTGDITSFTDCRDIIGKFKPDYILHNAALGSVPRSLVEPELYEKNNAQGFMNILKCARKFGVKKVVYASSSSVYGDLSFTENFDFNENRIGAPLSPYAASKQINEIHAKMYSTCYGLETVGLRYFNVFGSRAKATGQYVNLIPGWITAIHTGKPVYINGDGSISRDFCHVDNIVQANILAALSTSKERVFNVGTGTETSILDLFKMLPESFREDVEPIFRDVRAGDMNRTCANIDLISKVLDYKPTMTLTDGISSLLHSSH